MKKQIFTISLLLLVPSFSYADRFPGGDPKDQCQTDDIDECGEGGTCEIVGFGDSLDFPYPIYACVDDETSQMSVKKN